MAAAMFGLAKDFAKSNQITGSLALEG